MNTSILRFPQVKEITGLSKGTIYNYMKEGSFPKQIKLGDRAMGWVKSDVEDWIQSRIDESRKA